MEERIAVRDRRSGQLVEYIRADLWPVDVSHGVHIAGVTFGLSLCIAGVVTQVSALGAITAWLLPPPGIGVMSDATPYIYDPSGMRNRGWHRPNECRRRVDRI